MPRAFGFDGDSAYYESLSAAVRKSEADKVAAAKTTRRERRTSIGLPAEETMSKKELKREKEEREGKKSVSEKMANFMFNGGRTHTVEDVQTDRVVQANGEASKGPRQRGLEIKETVHEFGRVTMGKK